jgi:LPXTG-motif cell wall-anchored protein
MQIKHRVLRLAAAVTVSTFLVAGAVAPVAATETAGEQGDDTTTSSHGRQAAQERKAERTQDETDETETADSEQDDATVDHTDGNASTEGDVDGEQPESTADENDGGANSYDCEEGPEGPYCGTERTEDSANGAGDGEATGRPGAGTVGKADNKNPRGQEPGPSDSNNGYECDGNEGIAKGNPAHTGCTDGEPVEMTCPEGATMNDEGECVGPAEADGTCPEDATMNDDGECVVPATEVAGAEAETGTEVLGVQAERAATDEAALAPASGILPATGAGDYALIILAGVGLLGAGGVLLARRRAQVDG